MPFKQLKKGGQTIACLYSGGKDSTLAIHKMHELNKKVDLLITLKPENPDSYMFHRPNIEFTALQSKALGIRQELVATKGEKEAELADLEEALRANGVSGVVTGALASRYQKDRVDKICEKLKITHYAPLWGINPLSELKEISQKFDAIITKVAAYGMDYSFLGARIDESTISRLESLNRKYGINISFEGGEAESFVLDAPLFRSRISIVRASKEWHNDSGTYLIEEAKLVPKKGINNIDA